MNNKILNLNFVAMFLLLMFSGCGGGGETQAVATPSVTLSADKTQAKASTTDNVTLTATVRDGNGVPLVGQAIDFNVPVGTYPYVSSLQTDLNGNAVIHLSYPPVGPNKSAVITVTAASLGETSNEVTITFANPQEAPAFVTLTTDKTSLTADGRDRVTLTATVTDAVGLPLVGQACDFNVPAGPYFVGISRYTNNTGQSNAFIYSRFTPGMTGPISISGTAITNGVKSNAINITVYPP